MKLCNKFKWVACVGFVASGMAWAGPEVNVTFKNNTGDAAHYSAVGSNGIATQSNASPSPQTIVAAGQTNTYKVRSSLSPDRATQSLITALAVRRVDFRQPIQGILPAAYARLNGIRVLLQAVGLDVM